MSIPGSASPLLLASTAAAASGYQISRSLRFNSADSAYLSRTPAVAGNRRTWTWAGWKKFSKLSGTSDKTFAAFDGTNIHYLEFPSNSFDFATYNGSHVFQLTTTQVFRDTSAWYHILIAFDTTQATSSNRVKIYINGTEITTFSTANYPALNYDGIINSTQAHSLGAAPPGTYVGYMDGYLADIHFIDGQALTPSSFTEVSATTGQLIPKAYSGSFGTNGFWLKFSDNSAATAATLGKDYSGNSNNWTPNNLSVTAGAGNDSLVDTPTSTGTDTGVGNEVRGNYCTLNPLGGYSSYLANGNLDYSASGGGIVCGTIALPSSGKWYWEISPTTSKLMVGIQKTDSAVTDGYLGVSANGYGYDGNDGKVWYNATGTAYGNTFTSGNVIGVAFDADNGKLFFSIDNTWQNSGNPLTGANPAASSLTGSWIPALGRDSATAAGSANFGQRAFAYTAPSGFKALCDTNLGAPLIAKPNEVMDVVLRTGTGTSGGTISSLNFSADFIWSKLRSASSSHYLLDSVRGIANTLQSNATASEASYSTWFTSITSTGYTVGSGDWASAASVVEWCWDAGTSTVSNTQGSITSQVRANASAGFSVVTYTGTGANATVGHGGLVNLSSGMIIVKSRTSSARQWPIYHAGNKGTGNNLNPQSSYIYLNLTNSAPSSGYSGFWNDTAPTSTVFSVGTDGGTNASGENFVAYCFVPVVGYSSFGSFVPNGTADSSFVYCGFRPRFFLIKNTSATSNWITWDTARDSYNYASKELYPNLSDAEVVNSSTYSLDILSNGFKVRNPGLGSGGTWIFAAWAEAPFQYARAR